MTVSLNMLTGPYHEPFLEASVRSVLNIVDEIVFVDTAPGNNPNRKVMEWVLDTVPGKIIDMPRGEDKDFSFAEARELARQNSAGDWILRFDADEVFHEKDIERLMLTVQKTADAGIECAFYHHMVYPHLYQYIEPRIILYRKDKGSWSKGVHEQLHLNGTVERRHEIKYNHYGYCRGQAEVFKRWKLYMDIDGHPNFYAGRDPNDIIWDRIAVCHTYTDKHPAAVQDTLNRLFPNKIETGSELNVHRSTGSVIGLLIIGFDGDNLDEALQNLVDTVNTGTFVYVAHTKDAVLNKDILKSSKMISPIYREFDSSESLAKTMNIAFKQLLNIQQIGYIGWFHPDMIGEENWLSALVSSLNANPTFGKVCSYNTRDGAPHTNLPFKGHEQAYLILRGVLERIGLFDEDFIGIGGYEDWDMNNRILEEGFQIMIEPASKVLHKGMQTRSKRDTTPEQHHNAQVYARKWGSYEAKV